MTLSSRELMKIGPKRIGVDTFNLCFSFIYTLRLRCSIIWFSFRGESFFCVPLLLFIALSCLSPLFSCFFPCFRGVCCLFLASLKRFLGFCCSLLLLVFRVEMTRDEGTVIMKARMMITLMTRMMR